MVGNRLSSKTIENCGANILPNRRFFMMDVFLFETYITVNQVTLIIFNIKILHPFTMLSLS